MTQATRLTLSVDAVVVPPPPKPPPIPTTLTPIPVFGPPPPWVAAGNVGQSGSYWQSTRSTVSTTNKVRVDKERCTAARTVRFGLVDVTVVRWSSWWFSAAELVTASVLAAWINTAAWSEHAVPHSAASSPPTRADGPRNRSVDHTDSGAQVEGR